jgi:hypothetical protein
MTKPAPDKVRAMPAGPELDALVARYVCGIDVLGLAMCAAYDGCWDVACSVEENPADSGYILRPVFLEEPGDLWASSEIKYPRVFGYTALALGVVEKYSTEWEAAGPLLESCPLEWTIDKGHPPLCSVVTVELPTAAPDILVSWDTTTPSDLCRAICIARLLVALESP